MPDDGLPERLFAALSPAQAPGGFALRVLALSGAALLPVLALYVGQVPGMAAHVLSGGAASARFLRQVLTNGVPVVFVLTWATALMLAGPRARGRSLRTVLALDAALRLALFAGGHAAVFAGSALVFGSFGGDPAQALRVLGPTLGAAAGFGNLAGVYLYAALLAALPLQVAVLRRRWPAPATGGAIARHPGLAWLASAGVLGAQAWLLSAVARVLSG
ncbi:MAG: hypothetical protein JJU42_14815 [Rhodobacteraceae bacterium]|nr:hypothetical protein [Paracoccaceae bacterium]